MPRVVDLEECRRRFAARFSGHLPPENRGDLLDWGRRYLPHFYTAPPSRMHRWLARLLDRRFPERGRRAAIVGPRGGAKSTVATMTYVLRQAVEGSDPYIMIVSDTESQAIDHLRAIKSELVENTYGLLDDYHFAVGEGLTWRENYIELRNGVVIHAVGTGSRIRGRRRRQHRPSLIVLDDPENDSHTESAIQREKTRRWFNRTLMNMGDVRTNVLVLGSALHRESLVVQLASSPGWTTRRVEGKPAPFRAVERWPINMALWGRWARVYNDTDNPRAERDARRFYVEHREEMRLGSRLCWPGRESLYGLMVERAQTGSAAFEAEKQGNPINPATCEWPEEYFTHDKFWFDEWPRDLVVKTMAVDPSKGRSDRRSDYSAIASIGVSRSGAVYVDVDMSRRSTDRIVADAVAGYARFAPAAIGVEANAFQSLLAEDVAETAAAEGLEMSVVPIDNTVNKIVRVRRLSTLLSRRRIRFKSGSPGAMLCVQQLRDFPNGDHDDGPDALEMACRLAFNRMEQSAAWSGDGVGEIIEVDYGN